MLKEWEIGNFKAISKNIKLNMCPLTVFAGINSSGKSTVLQSILLVSQTLRATASQKPLVLNGEFVRLGYLSDVLHNGRQHLPLEIGFRLDTLKNNSSPSDVNNGELINLRAKFMLSSENSNNSSSEANLDEVTLSQGDTSINLNRLPSKNQSLSKHEEFSVLKMENELRKELVHGSYDYKINNLQFPEYKTEGKWFSHISPFELYGSLSHFLPGKILETYDATTALVVLGLQTIGKIFATKREKKWAIEEINKWIEILSLMEVNDLKRTPGIILLSEIQKALEGGLRKYFSFEKRSDSSLPNDIRLTESYLARSSTIVEFISTMRTNIHEMNLQKISEFLYYEVSQFERMSNENCDFPDIGVRFAELPPSLAKTRSTIIDYFSNHIYYLGPLRDEPHFLYSLPPYPEVTHVGLKGEFTASVLDRFKDQEIDYPIPPEQGQVIMKMGKATLMVALGQWLKYMKLLESVHTTDKGKVGTELIVRQEGVNRDLDLTSIGVGVSQVLPTLVMGLIAPSGTTFLLEQPELHLHPQMQSAIADFLLGLSMFGKQCIVETHSEYLLTRLRRRIAEDETSRLTDLVQIYFVERNEGISEFRKLDLNEYGSVLDWPKGFFDEGPNEAQLIMEASLRKRKAKKNNSTNRTF